MEAFVEASVTAFVEAFVKAPRKLAFFFCVEASISSVKASTPSIAFMEASTASIASMKASMDSFHSFHGSFHELPQKMQAVQETIVITRRNYESRALRATNATDKKPEIARSPGQRSPG